ncbi:LytR/AlgR family response regulator transcription factor [Acanthopleuribacter pedis]|uniref:Response regulator transcription factor n=1 Tax=Acanthopleuribacter pedis TaxID=442870 RepID=A0A8J7U3A3_9BACT|nr:LytTR family DNA-binding domain-containing protein [Acanthopleuribacter pedis]MBO1319427.1 response regulator transcription factor [Acanthopleuribacter pedis]
MHVLIVEDEWPIAEDLQDLIRELLGDKLSSIRIETTLDDGLDSLAERPVDLLFLDLNLHGRNGFDILKQAVACRFHTIIVSANTDRALEAFEYGVLDFVAKPYRAERLRQALARLDGASDAGRHLKFLTVRERAGLRMIPIDTLRFIQGAGVYSELHLKNGERVDCEKTLNRLAALLGDRALRIHKSYLVMRGEVRGLQTASGGKHDLILSDGCRLPVSRARYKDLKAEFEG